MQTTFPLRKHSNPRTIARRVVEALPRGVVLATSDAREAVPVGREIDELVRLALPDVQGQQLLFPRGEQRWWLWWLGEFEGAAGFYRQEPEEGVALFPEHERGSREVQWRATPRARQRGRR
jgi:hypothetical protein